MFSARSRVLLPKRARLKVERKRRHELGQFFPRALVYLGELFGAPFFTVKIWSSADSGGLVVLLGLVTAVVHSVRRGSSEIWFHNVPVHSMVRRLHWNG